MTAASDVLVALIGFGGVAFTAVCGVVAVVLQSRKTRRDVNAVQDSNSRDHAAVVVALSGVQDGLQGIRSDIGTLNSVVFAHVTDHALHTPSITLSAPATVAVGD